MTQTFFAPATDLAHGAAIHSMVGGFQIIDLTATDISADEPCYEVYSAEGIRMWTSQSLEECLQWAAGDAFGDAVATPDAMPAAASDQPARLPEALTKPIHTLADGIRFICDLIDHDLAFNFDDNPADIIHLESGDQTFHESDWPILEAQIECLYQLDWGHFGCPLGAMLALNHEIEATSQHAVVRDTASGDLFPAYRSEEGQIDPLRFGELKGWAGPDMPRYRDLLSAAYALTAWLDGFDINA